MAENIKKISSFSEDGIQQAIARVFHGASGKQHFEDKLEELSRILVEKERKKGNKDKRKQNCFLRTMKFIKQRLHTTNPHTLQITQQQHIYSTKSR